MDEKERLRDAFAQLLAMGQDQTAAREDLWMMQGLRQGLNRPPQFGDPALAPPASGPEPVPMPPAYSPASPRPSQLQPEIDLFPSAQSVNRVPQKGKR